MGIATVIMGNSGAGKSTSLRNLNPEDCLLIQTVAKPLPFPNAKEWKPFDKESKSGSVICTNKSKLICRYVRNIKAINRKTIIIDDAQYVMAFQMMQRASEKSYDKFVEIGVSMFEILEAVVEAPEDVTVYILTHSDENEYGMNAKVKTVGKMLDKVICFEGLFSICLRAVRDSDGEYIFQTQSVDNSTAKSPMGLFKETEPNDLAQLDKQIRLYFGV